jgi:hypothetical protein
VLPINVLGEMTANLRALDISDNIMVVSEKEVERLKSKFPDYFAITYDKQPGDESSSSSSSHLKKGDDENAEGFDDGDGGGDDDEEEEEEGEEGGGANEAAAEGDNTEE